MTTPVATLEERLAAAEPVQVARAALGERDGVWIVGGAIRDALTGSTPIADLDLAVADDPERAARAVKDAVVETMGRSAVFQLSDAFGAWRVIGPDWRCDVTLLQGETIEADLRARDFTINAMALPLRGGELIDPFGGRGDLAGRTLRMVADDAYARDRLRPLRLARFATELAFEPEAATAAATRKWAPALSEVPGERVFAELRRIVVAPRVLEGLRLSESLGVLRAVLPELDELHGVEQSHFHHLDVYKHTIEVLRGLLDIEERLTEFFPDDGDALRAVLDEPFADELTRGEALRFGALLHDIGKVPTRAVMPSGRVTFIGHDQAGADMVRATCTRLRASERLREYLAALTRHHLVLGFLVHERPLSRRDVYRYLKRCSPVEVEVTVLTCADRLATRGRNAETAIEAHLDLARELMTAALEWRASPPRPPVRGDELAAQLQLEPGPDLGRLLAELEEAAYAGEVTTADQAVEWARRLRDNEQR